MKIKVKGLVFVGFAAAILSANAALAENENTVTSKSFTEARYQAKTAANQNGKVLQMASNTAGDIGYISIDSMVTENSDNLVTSGAVQAAIEAVETGAGTSYQDRSVSAEAQYVADGNGGWEALDKATSVTANDTKPVTAQAVYNALNDTTNGHSNYQTYSTTAQQVSDGAGGWEALTTTATPTQNSTAPFSAGGAYALDAAKEDVSNKTQTVAASGSTSSNKYPSETAVRAAITAVETAAASAYQAYSTTAQQVSDGDGGWTALTKDTTVTQNSANPVTSGAVYDAIQNATGGNTIPEKNPAICDATGYAPCALVAESNGLHWYTIATADHAGGVLGDATQGG